MITCFCIFTILGIYSFINLPFSLYPSAKSRKLYININSISNNPEEVESKTTRLIVDELNSFKGINKITSYSSPYHASIMLELSHNSDIKNSTLLIREHLSLLKESLPQDTRVTLDNWVPEEFKSQALMGIAVYGDIESSEFTSFFNNDLKTKLSGIAGISSVKVLGKADKKLDLSVKKEYLNLFNSADIIRKIQLYSNSYSYTGAKWHGEEHLLTIPQPLKSIEDIQHIPIEITGSIRELAEVVNVSKIDDYGYSYYRFNSKPMLYIEIQKEPDANTVSLSKKIKKVMETIQYPDNVNYKIIDNEAKIINAELKQLYKRAILCITIIIFVLMFFLKSIRSTIFVITSIFLSLLGTFSLMKLFGVELNIISLTGITFGFGIIVDNAIVVYESILSNKQSGKDLVIVVSTAINSVSLPLIACTVTTTIVFLPFLYLMEEVKSYYLPFVFSVVFALTSSLLVSFSFLPLVSRLISGNITKTQVVKNNSFRKIMLFLIKHRWYWYLFTLLIFVTAVLLFIYKVPHKAFNEAEINKVGIVSIATAVGSPIELIDMYSSEIEKYLAENSFADYYTTIDRNNATIKIMFADDVIESKASQLVAGTLSSALNLGGADIRVNGYGVFGSKVIQRTFSSNNIKISCNNYGELIKYAKNIAKQMKEQSRFVNNITFDSKIMQVSKNKEYTFKVKKEFPSINNQLLQQKIVTATSEVKSRVSFDGEDYLVEVNGDSLVTNPDYIYLEGDNSKQLVNISNLGELKLTQAPDIITREGNLYQLFLHYHFSGPPSRLRKFKKDIQENIIIPDGFKLVYDYNTKQKDDTSKQLLLALIAAFFLVYLAMSALFESVKLPFIIMITVPLAFIGISFLFYTTNTVYDNSAQIGSILLIGMAINSSIITLFQIDKLNKKGIPLLNATLQGVESRIRPIMMTTITTIGGLIPLIIKSESSSDFWRTLSLATIGGLLISTFFVIFLLPIIYFSFNKKR